MSEEPRVSVVMPAFNAEAFIVEAIASVLAQAHRPLEVIVVDDGSTDSTAALAASFGGAVRLHRQANAGPPTARNRGLELATGEFVTFLDADDLFTPEMLVRQLARMRRRPDIDIVLGGMRHFEDGDPDGASLRQEGEISLQLSCGLFRRSVFDTVGRFDPALWQCDDWDWFMRARELRVGLLLHRDVVVHHRLHGANLTRDREAAKRYQAMMFKRSLERRRARNGVAAVLPPLSAFMEPEPSEGLK